MGFVYQSWSQTNKYPQPETEYHVPLPEDDPGYQIQEISNVNTEFGLRFKKYYESGDYAFFAASLNENQPSYSAASETGNEKIELEKKISAVPTSWSGWKYDFFQYHG